ncbi:putative Heterochromatin-associated protein MENT [Hypsibius exemplaris]|uniref:Heterochromatin-associated protein MENT n=1 Tax=Hypsibius exemplaris TaxID=2072580 RepID=A0A1W0WFW3_HYPEX|nr:putative Heterochromatin-associated protein MENT [Hypsibius exemplaris]
MEQLRRPLDHMAQKFFWAANTVLNESQGNNSNVIVSPFAGTVLATMWYLAANGKAERQLDQLLGYQALFEGRAEPKNIQMAFREALKTFCRTSSNDSEEARNGHLDASATPFQLILRNHLFIQPNSGVKAQFIETVRKYLSVDSEEVDFFQRSCGRKEMTKWLTEQAGALDLTKIPPVAMDGLFEGNRMTTMSLAYYRGSWEIPFDPALTSRQPFHLEDGTTKDVEMMTLTEKFPFYEDEAGGLLYIEIPYYRNGGSLVLTMPVKKGISVQMQHMDQKTFTNLHMRKRMKLTKLTLPKINAQCSFELERLFHLVGIREVIHDQSDLSHMTEDPLFRLSEGLVTCAIQIDESGSFINGQQPSPPDEKPPPPPPVEPTKAWTAVFTKIAAVSALSAAAKPSANKSDPAVPAGCAVFNANRPFFIGVRHNKTSALLFAGSYVSP